MPHIQSLRHDLLDWLFDGAGTGGFINSYIGFCTGAPGDTGTTANESSLARTTRSASYSFDSTSGYLSYTPNLQWSVTSTETLTYWFSGASATSHSWYEQFPIAVNAASGGIVRFAPYRLRWRFSDVVVGTMAQEALEYIVYNQTPISPSTSYIALSSTAPARDGTNVTEPTGGAYARAVFNTGDRNTVSATTSYAYNSSPAIFPTATAPWSGLTHWAMYTTSTGGTPYFAGALDSTVNVLTGEQPRFLTNDWQVSYGP